LSRREIRSRNHIKAPVFNGQRHLFINPAYWCLLVLAIAIFKKQNAVFIPHISRPNWIDDLWDH
jgi:hypothetical protein